ncbi:MAG: DUF2235 domain-containing protein [Alphaproteobacteria bacterium]|nr:DUF2235 domain-containing protein [Alphaproteobacteria bacterium]
MSRNLILLSDGTGNSSAKLFKTNVWRLYEALELDGGRQIAIYDDGVGTASNKYLAMLGGAFGFGLKRNVLRLYRFVCRNYRAGDAICGFGFSRGAFTIRVLVGLINSQGLVPPGDERTLKRAVKQAYRAYRARGYEQRYGFARLGRGLRDAWLAAWFRLRGFPPYDPAQNRRFAADERPVRFLGLWDTVDAYGLPIDELTDAVDKWIWPLKFDERELCPLVARACHVLSVDDERTTFHPVMWDEKNEPANATGTIAGERISQVWFAGVHSNVGGGYSDDRLAHVSLLWIMEEATKAGIVFTPAAWPHLTGQADKLGRIYDSRSGGGAYYRYQPRRISSLATASSVAPKIHESVLDRMAVGIDGYAPLALPSKFHVVTTAGAIVPAAPFLAALPADPKLAIPPIESMKIAWDGVWWRRVLYFVTVAASLPLLLFPALFVGKIDSTSAVGQALERSEDAVSGLLGRLFDILDAVLPSFVAAWTAAFRQRPITFLVIAGLLVALMVSSGKLQGRIRTAMRAAWTQGASGSPPQSNLLLRFARAVRENRCVNKAYARLTDRAVPALFAALIVIGALHLANRVLFELFSATGQLCAEPSGAANDLAIAQPFTLEAFDTRNPCQPAGVTLTKDARYRIEIAVTAAWQDGGIKEAHGKPLGPAGFRSPWWHPAMWLAVPMRRHVLSPWLQPFARIGAYGRDEYDLAPHATVITARKTGPLFLFVNDAVLINPRWFTCFYDNNGGTAKITVTKIENPPRM